MCIHVTICTVCTYTDVVSEVIEVEYLRSYFLLRSSYHSSLICMYMYGLIVDYCLHSEKYEVNFSSFTYLRTVIDQYIVQPNTLPHILRQRNASIRRTSIQIMIYYAYVNCLICPTFNLLN